MEKLKKNVIYINFFKIIFNNFKKNIKLFISIILTLIIVIIIYQVYLFQNNKKILELSILYDQAKSNINSVEFDQNMNAIAKEKGFYGMLASLELIKNKYNNKNYNEAYVDYINLLDKNDTNKIYRNIIALHGSFNLLDNVSTNKIERLLSYIDEFEESFIGYHYEILFLLSIKNNNDQKKNEIYKQILEHEKISNTIKNRVQKIYEFEKYN